MDTKKAKKAKTAEKTKKVYKAITIVKWMTDEAKKHRASISIQKISQIMYYAEGIFLASQGKSLFLENIVAGPDGPIVDFYNITGDKRRPESDFYNASEKIDKKDEENLKKIYMLFMKHSEDVLRKQILSEKPWLDASDNGKRYGRLIDRNVMKDFFAENIFRRKK